MKIRITSHKKLDRVIEGKVISSSCAADRIEIKTHDGWVFSFPNTLSIGLSEYLIGKDVIVLRFNDGEQRLIVI